MADAKDPGARCWTSIAGTLHVQLQLRCGSRQPCSSARVLASRRANDYSRRSQPVSGAPRTRRGCFHHDEGSSRSVCHPPRMCGGSELNPPLSSNERPFPHTREGSLDFGLHVVWRLRPGASRGPAHHACGTVAGPRRLGCVARSLTLPTRGWLASSCGLLARLWPHRGKNCRGGGGPVLRDLGAEHLPLHLPAMRAGR